MIDLSNRERTVWHNLKQGSLGTVLWAVRSDERFISSFSEALSNLGSKDGLATALNYAVLAATNCIGQLALYQFAADQSAQPRLEPRDHRWNPLRTLNDQTVHQIALSIGSDSSFDRQLRQLLANAVGTIKNGNFRRIFDLGAVAEGSDVYREFLILLGIALGRAIESQGKTFAGTLGEVAALNESTEAPFYAFQNKGPSQYGIGRRSDF